MKFERLSLFSLFLCGVLSSLTYIGCYTDDRHRRVRDLPTKAAPTHSEVTCGEQCRALGFRYAGQQWISECFCGNTYGSQGTSTRCGDEGLLCASGTKTCSQANAVYDLQASSSDSNSCSIGRQSVEFGMPPHNHDIDKIEDATVGECQEACELNLECIGFSRSTRKTGVDDRGWCFLKSNDLPAKQSFDGWFLIIVRCVGLEPATTEAPQQRQPVAFELPQQRRDDSECSIGIQTVEHGMPPHKFDLENGSLEDATVDECQAECELDPLCMGYSRSVSETGANDRGWCFLKSDDLAAKESFDNWFLTIVRCT